MQPWSPDPLIPAGGKIYWRHFKDSHARLTPFFIPRRRQTRTKLSEGFLMYSPGHSEGLYNLFLSENILRMKFLP